MIPKFRAWDKFDKVMRDVTLLDYNQNFVGYGYPIFMKSTMHMELMRSTGLLDKNGEEIFEGDIVDYKGRKAIVNWHGSYASFIYRFVDESHKRNAEWKPLYLAYMRCEIIGNIYKNPEFLEVKD